jgi:protein-tyrosine phosphatase
MIDIHAHILPGLDHGARDWEESLDMCRQAVDDGISVMAATPHVSEAYPNTEESILAVADELRRRLADAAIPLEIVVGGDYHIRLDLASENVLTLNGNGRYFLLEFPYEVVPPNADAFVEILVQKRGLVPVITHPERIYSLHGREVKLEKMVEKGALVQITGGSLTGAFGPPCRQSAERMLRSGLVHVIASDAHWSDERPPLLSASRTAAARIVGEEAARKLVQDNPRAIIEGRDLP